MNRPKSTLTGLAAAMLAVGIAMSPLAVPKAQAQISFQLGWQQPPQDFNDIQRDGFRAGLQAGRDDIDHGMPPDARRHWDFRRPRVPPPARDQFRDSFRRGYGMAYDHRGDWDRDHHDWRRDGDRDHRDHDGDHHDDHNHDQNWPH